MKNKSRTLPDGAYEALEGLKAQAEAAILMMTDKDSGKAKLRLAHSKMSANDSWTRKIIRAIMTSSDKRTIDTVDNVWLEEKFSGAI